MRLVVLFLANNQLEQQIWKIKRKKENIRLQKALNKKRFESIKKSVTKIRKQFTKARGEIASSFCGWKYKKHYRSE